MKAVPRPWNLPLGLVCWAFTACVPTPEHNPLTLNDVHSRLNPTTVAEWMQPQTVADIIAVIERAKRTGHAISISGGRHAMGGQAFGTDTLHLNMSAMDRVLHFDPEHGLVTVEAGIQWPALIDWLWEHQREGAAPWAIRQKQTGADSLSIGGALSANIHGRGLTLPPIIGDVESLRLVNAEGQLLHCSREENAELFRLAIGGYGLFGVLTDVTLRLTPREALVREVAIVSAADVVATVQERVEEGYAYGDFQFLTDENSPDFLQRGVLSLYRPSDRFAPKANKKLGYEDWVRLYELAHTDKARAFSVYSDFYLSTHGQSYWTDTHQLSTYVQDHDAEIDRLLSARAPGSLMICEYYVPRPQLVAFLRRTGESLRANHANLIYGTVRFIAKDDESLLAWARQDYACTVLNLRVTHDPQGLADAKRQFRAITDIALDLDGSYFLTYHRWATQAQVEAAYPQFREFLRKKRQYDPEERFQSDWYRHYQTMFGDR